MAPLAAGGVHRLSMFLLLMAAALGLALLVAGELTAGAILRTTLVAAVPAVLLAIAALQSLPLPSALSNWLDPVGAELIAGSPRGHAALRPYSLDPPSTRVVLGRAAAALAVFLAAAHLSSGRSFRHLMLRVIVGAGIAAVIIGLGHRMLGEAKVYGSFSGSTGLLNGPFVNQNHTAQFLEIAFFAALALAYTKSSALNRVGWLAAAVFLIAGALGTLSRGGVLALAISGTIFLAFRNAVERDERERGGRTSKFWMALVLVLIVIVASSLGASQLVAKFSQSSLTQDTRFRLWADGFKLVVAHPFGIGLGAFERVYPSVQTLEGDFAVRFSFVENEALQMLIETGWLGLLALIAGLGLLIREIYRHGRRDRIELALLCALIAVLTHNLVDFGLETLGVLLPFSAVLGTIVGRTKRWSERLLPRTGTMAFAAAAALGLVIGAGSLTAASASDFDTQIRNATTATQRREAARRAQVAHPADYFYVLAEASTEPLAPTADGNSPRLRVLNRALTLCPRCPEIHTEVARSLWKLGKRRQALIEWKIAVKTRRLILDSTLDEAWRLGARPHELPVIGGDDPRRLIAIAEFLMSKSARADARKVIDSALMAGAPPTEIHLLRAHLSLEDGQVSQALGDIAAVEKVAPNDPRAFALRAEAVLKSAGPLQAMDVLDKGVAVNPHDLPLQRRRLQLVIETEKWSRAQGALEGLQIALYHARLPTTEVHVAGARIAVGLGDSKRAISEYRTAINQNGKDPSLWMALGAFYESLGRLSDALQSYRDAQLLVPGNADVAAAIERVTARRTQIDATTTRGNLLTTP